jgi:hypothetical protein
VAGGRGVFQESLGSGGGDEMKPTPSRVKIIHSFNVVTEDGRRNIASCGGYANNKDPKAEDENQANAELIKAMWNACHSINPTNLQAVAEGIGETHKRAIVAEARVEEAIKEVEAWEGYFKNPRVEGMLWKIKRKLEGN